jgi:hypothetical protein
MAGREKGITLPNHEGDEDRVGPVEMVAVIALFLILETGEKVVSMFRRLRGTHS